MRKATRTTIIIGLPASGKTTKALDIYRERLLDVMCSPPILFDDISGDTLKIWKSFLGNYRTVVTDPFLCDIDNLKKCINDIQDIKPLLRPEFILFENNPEACLKNATHRKNKPVNSLIRRLSQTYDIDAICELLKEKNYKYTIEKIPQ